MPSNTKYHPQNINEFERTKLNFNSHGVTCNPTVGTSTNLDYTLVDDCLITGIELIIHGATLGDYVDLQVVDTTGSFTGTPGTIVLQPATNWYVYTSTSTQFEIVYPAKVFTGLTLRAVYNSIGTVTPFLAVNYKLHKCLV